MPRKKRNESVKPDHYMHVYSDFEMTEDGEMVPVARGGGGGGPSRSRPNEPSLIWVQDLPKTVAEVKRYSKAHTQFENRGLSDEFKFKLWCVLIPRSLLETAEGQASPSEFLLQNREALGNSLPDDVLMLTKVKGDGSFDLGFAADVKRALDYNEEELPALLFVREPQIRIYKSYENQDLLQLRGQPLNGLAITFGGCKTDGVRRFMKTLPGLLAGGEVPVDRLEKLLKKSESAAARAQLWQGTKAVGKYVAATAPGVITIVSGIVKFTGLWPGHA